MGSKPKTPTPGGAGFGSGIVPGTGSGFGDNVYAGVNTGGVQATPIDHNRLDAFGINMPQTPGQQPAIPNTYGQGASGVNPMTQLYGQPAGGYNPMPQAMQPPSNLAQTLFGAPQNAPAVMPDTIPGVHMPRLNRQKPVPDYRQMRIDQVLGHFGQQTLGGQKQPQNPLLNGQAFQANRRFRGGGY